MALVPASTDTKAYTDKHSKPKPTEKEGASATKPKTKK